MIIFKDAQQEWSDAIDAWIEAHEKHEANEAALPESFENNMNHPKVMAWLESMYAEAEAAEVANRAELKAGSVANN